ncbi:MAG: hypothetical protein OXR68_07570 [Alphaproteobacteria bacterium]|nr:hypothetical protein [Alphaproteobacteria bacterium]MDD9920462.1 hypothetical protein [Alphaproteobacteria bacterium]
MSSRQNTEVYRLEHKVYDFSDIYPLTQQAIKNNCFNGTAIGDDCFNIFRATLLCYKSDLQVLFIAKFTFDDSTTFAPVVSCQTKYDSQTEFINSPEQEGKDLVHSMRDFVLYINSVHEKNNQFAKAVYATVAINDSSYSVDISTI